MFELEMVWSPEYNVTAFKFLSFFTDINPDQAHLVSVIAALIPVSNTLFLSKTVHFTRIKKSKKISPISTCKVKCSMCY